MCSEVTRKPLGTTYHRQYVVNFHCSSCSYRFTCGELSCLQLLLQLLIGVSPSFLPSSFPSYQDPPEEEPTPDRWVKTSQVLIHAGIWPVGQCPCRPGPEASNPCTWLQYIGSQYSLRGGKSLMDGFLVLGSSTLSVVKSSKGRGFSPQELRWWLTSHDSWYVCGILKLSVISVSILKLFTASLKLFVGVIWKVFALLVCAILKLSIPLWRSLLYSICLHCHSEDSILPEGLRIATPSTNPSTSQDQWLPICRIGIPWGFQEPNPSEYQ